MMTARVITTLLLLPRPMHACIVVMTLAVIMAWRAAHHVHTYDEYGFLRRKYPSPLTLFLLDNTIGSTTQHFPDHGGTFLCPYTNTIVRIVAQNLNCWSTISMLTTLSV